MVCPQCGERTLNPKQRFCHSCGAMLHNAAMIPAGNHVGDGGEQAMSTFNQHGAGHWTPKARLMVYGGGGAVVAIAAAIAVVMFVSALVMFITMAIPLLVIASGLYIWLRLKLRRNRRWARF